MSEKEIHMGRHIGTWEGWDEIDDFAIVLYDFKPASGIDLPECDLCVCFQSGTYQVLNDDGDLIIEKDMIEVLRDVPRA